MDICKNCKKELVYDEIALYKRLCGKLSNEFCCLGCMAKHFRVSEELLLDKIKQFREDGCTLFTLPGKEKEIEENEGEKN